MTGNPSEEVMTLVREMREGLEGVKPGKWEIDGVLSVNGVETRATVYWLPDPDNPSEDDRICDADVDDARHITRCSPDNIRLLLDHIEAQEADRVSCQARVEELERALRSIADRRGVCGTCGTPATGDGEGFTACDCARPSLGRGGPFRELRESAEMRKRLQ